MIVIQPSSPSRGATTLKRALIEAGHKAVISYKQKFRRQHTFVKWGKPSDKLADFNALKAGGVRVPDFLVGDFVPEPQGKRKDIWLARTILNGSCGRGIVVIREGDPVPVAPLYVKYVPKLQEFRVHVVNGQVVFVQEKRKKNGAAQTENQKLIRNHGNGWVFCKEDVQPPDGTKEQAVATATALGLQVAAVDIVIGKKDKLPYVLEANTKPGLESPALIKAYVEALTHDPNQPPQADNLPGDVEQNEDGQD